MVSRPEPRLPPANPGVDLADAGHGLYFRRVTVEYRVWAPHHLCDGGHDPEELLLVLAAQRGKVLIVLVLVSPWNSHVVTAVIVVRVVRAFQRHHFATNDIHVGTLERPAIVHVVTALGQIGRLTAVDVDLANDRARVGAVVEQVGDGLVIVGSQTLARLRAHELGDVDRNSGVNLASLTASGDTAKTSQNQSSSANNPRDAQSTPLSIIDGLVLTK